MGGVGQVPSSSASPSLPIGGCSLTRASLNTRWALQFTDSTAAFSQSVLSVSSRASVAERWLSDLCFSAVWILLTVSFWSRSGLWPEFPAHVQILKRMWVQSPERGSCVSVLLGLHGCRSFVSPPGDSVTEPGVALGAAAASLFSRLSQVL